MKLKSFILALSLGLATVPLSAQDILIQAGNTDLALRVGPNKRLYQIWFGEALADKSDYSKLSWNVYSGSDGSAAIRGWEVSACAGGEDYYEPALSITHSDGSQATYLVYKSHRTKDIPGGTETVINMADELYPVEVSLHYAAYPEYNVICSWSEISHNEKAAGITLRNAYSPMLYIKRSSYYLTEFSSDWAREAAMSSQQLQFGKKIVDTKLGSRASMHSHPFFELGLDAEAREESGEVLMGTIASTGNWRYTLEVDNAGALRVLAGMNSSDSHYQLPAGQVFKTPDFIFTLSREGKGKGSRDLQGWARHYRLRAGMEPRMSLLNNWENTYFYFNQEKLAGLMKEAATLGVDLFLLDDGWFGNDEHARNGDYAGLGDWEVNRKKLPGGVPALCDAAEEAGVKFGIWIEPEMVNPNSTLFEKHPDWAITQPGRKTYLYRKQLVLDMANPEVQDYVYGVVERLLSDGTPDGDSRIAFFKWDCNSPITNIYSPYLGSKQSNLYYDHLNGVYNVFRRVKENYPNVNMMLCSGGGGRCDYEALKYFTEFWCSDNTDPVERLYIQWGFSQFFPAKAMCAHVTDWNKGASIKFRTDVASMCKLGFDLGLSRLSEAELEYLKSAVSNWKRLQDVILDGEQYRLVSPYEENHMAVDYVNADRSHAVLFAYDIHPRYLEPLRRLKLQGLDPDASYLIEEINLMPGTKSELEGNASVFSGDYLMKVGLNVFTQNAMQSRVLELTKVKD